MVATNWGNIVKIIASSNNDFSPVDGFK